MSVDGIGNVDEVVSIFRWISQSNETVPSIRYVVASAWPLFVECCSRVSVCSSAAVINRQLAINATILRLLLLLLLLLELRFSPRFICRGRCVCACVELER